MRLRNHNVAVRPIDAWPGQLLKPGERRSSQFRAKWSDTLELLDRELWNLNARAVVLQMAVQPGQVRKDETGLLAHVRPEHPGIVLSFTGGKGALSYPCDTFVTWHDNARAIAKTLENLRAVDRYGVSKGGQQYTGWSQLPPGRPMAGPMTREEAAAFIAEHADPLGRIPGMQTGLLAGRVVEAAYRSAAKVLHPDSVGGSTEAFQRLQEAKRVLDGAG